MPKKAGVPAWEPWQPAHWDDTDALAIQALERGTASDSQQQHALKFIVEVLAGTFDDPFRPGAEGSRLTDYALGKRHVGLQIIKLLKVKLSALKPSQESK